MNTIERNQPAEMERPSTRAGQGIRETASQLGETAARAGEGLEERLNNLEVKVNHVRASVVDKTTEYSRTADDYVRKNPWVAVGVSAGIAFLAGMLIGRRRGG